MSRADKSAAIAELAEKFRSSNSAVLTEYRGLSVAQITELRGALRGNATYAVVKNTLTELAAKDAGVTAFDGQLVGPTAIAFIEGDAVEAAKGLRDFAKANPHLVIKGGVLDGKTLSAALGDATNQILLGRQPVSSWDAAMDAWRRGGGDAVRSEYEQALATKE